MLVQVKTQESLKRTIEAGDDYQEAGNRLLAAAKEGLYSVERPAWSRDELHE